MNVMVLSGARNKRWKRHSIAVFNNSNNSQPITPFTRNLNPLHELGVSLDEPCAPRRGSEANKYLFILKRLIEAGDGLTVSDMELLRKACMERVVACATAQEKIFELKSFIHELNDVPIASNDSQWLAQYQYILNWCYSQLRFICDPAERQRHFIQIKEKYRQMFDQLSEISWEDKIASYLHWSQVCYQYAEFVDDQSMAWCMQCLRTERRTTSASSSRCSMLSSRNDSSFDTTTQGDSLPRAVKRANSRFMRYTEGLELIRDNLEKIESVRTALLKQQGYSEKIVM